MEMKVFVSSTLSDMMPYRQAAKKAILRVGMVPILLEDRWGKIIPKGRTALVAEEVSSAVSEADVFLLLVGSHYGNRIPGRNVSWIEFEAASATDSRKPFLLYLTEEFPPTTEKPADTDAFLRRLSARIVFRRVSSPEELAISVRRDLSALADQKQLQDLPQHVVLPRISLSEFRTFLENAAEIDKCSPRAFEELIADLLAADGWEVELVARNNAPGPDIVAFSSKIIASVPTMLVVECKKWRRDRPVDIDVVRKVMYWVNEEYHATFGMIATSSVFTRNALSEKEERHHWRLELRDYASLIKWIDRHSKWKGLSWKP